MPQERRSERRSGREERTAARRPRRGSTGRTAGFAVLYVVGVIGVSILLACLLWIAANDVLALNKDGKEVTITISSEDSFNSIVNRLEDEGLIEYKWLFKLFAAFTGGKDDVTMGTYTLNTDMDYRALLAGMSANSATRSVVDVVIPEGYTLDQIFALLEEKGGGHGGGASGSRRQPRLRLLLPPGYPAGGLPPAGRLPHAVHL